MLVFVKCIVISPCTHSPYVEKQVARYQVVEKTDLLCTFTLSPAGGGNGDKVCKNWRKTSEIIHTYKQLARLKNTSGYVLLKGGMKFQKIKRI